MLRALYIPHLLCYSLIVLIGGIILIPFGYIAILIIKARLIFKKLSSNFLANSPKAPKNKIALIF